MSIVSLNLISLCQKFALYCQIVSVLKGDFEANLFTPDTITFTYSPNTSLISPIPDLQYKA